MIKSALRRIFFHSGAGWHKTTSLLYLWQGNAMKTINTVLTQEELKATVLTDNRFVLDSVVSTFDPVKLEELEAHNLQERMDSKYLLDTALLPEILEAVQSGYTILNINDTSFQPYLTLYYDTGSYTNYFTHHNGKRPRFKIRMRKYVNSGASFLEVKEKDNKNRTIKTRMQIHDIVNRLSPEYYQFISEVYPLGLVPLKPVIWNRYDRLTLVNKSSLERVTIDMNFNAYNQNGLISWSQFAIVEIKQGERSLHTAFQQAIKEHSIKQVNFSKYCISMALLTPELKSNRFKPNIERIRTSLQRSLAYVG
jgi:hypothetical protein